MRYLQNFVKRICNVKQICFEDVRSEVDKIEGLLVPNQEEWLFNTARSLPEGAKIIEIGSYKGRSSVSIGYGCLASRKHLFSIDRFEGIYEDLDRDESLKQSFSEGFFNEWRTNIERNGLTEYVTPLIGDSKEIAKIWKSPIHMLFIDGSHLFDDVMTDFNNFSPFVLPNGVIALHDVVENWEGPFKAWNEYIKHELVNTGAVSTLAFGHKPGY